MNNIKHTITIQGKNNKVVFEIGEGNSISVFVPDPQEDNGVYGYSADVSIDDLCHVADQLRQWQTAFPCQFERNDGRNSLGRIRHPDDAAGFFQSSPAARSIIESESIQP